MFEALFWNSGPFAHTVNELRLIFLSGTIGCGKSTFVDYFLRCFYPHKSAKRASFHDTLVLHFDLKTDALAAAVDDKMWTDLELSLQRAGIDPTLIWDFAGENVPTQRAIRRVLKVISDKIKNGALGRKRYLVLVVDNIDQSPLECQSHTLSLVQDILEVRADIDVWRIVFPLWPQTLGQLRRESKLTIKATEYHEIELGHLNLSVFYEKRFQYLKASY